MRLPVIQGLIKRRILVNFRVDPEAMARQVPKRFRLKLQRGYAIAGVCLIRLEQIRPRILPGVVGVSSENAAHRVAVLWEEAGSTCDGVFIPRRDTSSAMNRLLGGSVFPGEHHPARFSVVESADGVEFSMKSRDGRVAVELRGHLGERLPGGSLFETLSEASDFFESGSLGYSTTSDPGRLDGLKLETEGWHVEPLIIDNLRSSYFDDTSMFPPGSAQLDHALIMRNIHHEWHSAADLYV